MTEIADLAIAASRRLPGGWSARTSHNGRLEVLERADQRVTVHLEPAPDGRVEITAYALPGGPDVRLGAKHAPRDADQIADLINSEFLPQLEQIDFVPDDHCHVCGRKIPAGVHIAGSFGPVCSYECYDDEEG